RSMVLQLLWGIPRLGGSMLCSGSMPRRATVSQKNREACIMTRFTRVLLPAAAWAALALTPIHAEEPRALAAGYSIPLIDLAADTARQVVIDREPGQYLGHPTTVLLEDNKTMLTVYPKGHGRGAIVMKRSDDAGLTWSDRLPLP